MKRRNNGETNMKSIVGTLALAAIAYVVAKSVPDIVRYLKISRM